MTIGIVCIQCKYSDGKIGTFLRENSSTKPLTPRFDGLLGLYQHLHERQAVAQPYDKKYPTGTYLLPQ